MIGWRAKLGVIVPSVNTTIEPELYRMAPPGVSIHSARVKLTEDTEQQLLRMMDDVPKCAEDLKHAGVDIIAFGCTSGSFIEGRRYDSEVIARIEKVAGIPAITTSTAVIQSLKEMGVQGISVVSPYEDWLNQRLVSFIESAGFKVLSIKGLGITKDIAHVQPEQVYQLVRQAFHPDSEGVFISCTDLRTIDILDTLEQDLKRPVISSNQAIMWKMLKMVGLAPSIRGFGSLLTKL